MPAVVHADICYSYGPSRAPFRLVSSASHASWLSKKSAPKGHNAPNAPNAPNTLSQCHTTLGHYGRRLRCSPSSLTRFNLRSAFGCFADHRRQPRSIAPGPEYFFCRGIMPGHPGRALRRHRYGECYYPTNQPRRQWRLARARNGSHR